MIKRNKGFYFEEKEAKWQRKHSRRIYIKMQMVITLEMWNYGWFLYPFCFVLLIPKLY